MPVLPLFVNAAAIGTLTCGVWLVVNANATQSIVGTWATPGKCSAPLSTVVVEPMAFSGEDFSCSFDTVSRTGDTVRWRGSCSFDADGAEKTVVTARLVKGALSYRINADGWNGPLRRCPRPGSAAL